MTEYSILIAFTFGIYHKTHNELCLLIGFITFFGEAMERYCRERKLLVVRLYAKKEVHQKMSSKTKRYPIDASFFSLTFKEQIECLKGLFLYRQVYFIIILSFASNIILTIGFAILAVWKNISWIKIVYNMLVNPPELKEGALDTAAYWKKSPKPSPQKRQ